MASRVALDTRRVVFEFDARDQSADDRVRRLYRHGRVVRHVAIDGRVTVEADVPRRLVPWLRTGESLP